MDVSDVEIDIIPEPLPFGSLRLKQGEPKVVKPGQEIVLEDFKPYGPKSTAVIVAMGVTQHPGTTYRYISDGREMTSLVPLGEFHAPLFTRRDLGRWLLVGERLTIHVRNDDVDAHMYASIIWSFDQDKS